VALWSSYFYYNAEVVHNGDKIKMRDAVGNFLKSPAVQVSYAFMHFSFTKCYFSVSMIGQIFVSQPVLRIRIRILIPGIRMFLGLPDPDPLVTSTDPATDLAPDPSTIKQKY
jgi:hypothetical protein